MRPEWQRAPRPLPGALQTRAIPIFGQVVRASLAGALLKVRPRPPGRSANTGVGAEARALRSPLRRRRFSLSWTSVAPSVAPTFQLASD
jgi:hypothetical protein